MKPKLQDTRFSSTDSRLVQHGGNQDTILDGSEQGHKGFLKTKTKVIEGELTIKSTEANAVYVIHSYR